LKELYVDVKHFLGPICMGPQAGHWHLMQSHPSVMQGNPQWG